MLRVHRTGYHPPGAVASELAWLQALRRDEGLLTPAVFPATDGREVVDVTIGPLTRQTVLFEWLDGTEPPDEDLADKFELLGEICAQMHRHSRSWSRPASFVRFSWDFESCVGETGRWGRWQDGIGVGPAERATLDRASAVMASRLRRFGMGPDRFGLIHADVRLANLLVSGPDIQVIDFDDCGFGWFLFDLGTALSFFEHDPRVPALCDAWQRGYRRIAPLPAQDAEPDPHVRAAAAAAARRLGRLAPVRRRGARARRRVHPGRLRPGRTLPVHHLVIPCRSELGVANVHLDQWPVGARDRRAKGIGKGLAAGFAAEGANVVIVGRDRRGRRADRGRAHGQGRDRVVRAGRR